MMQIKIQFNLRDRETVFAFLRQWIDPESKNFKLMFLEECEPIYFDCESTELSNCFMELQKKGFTQSIKEIFQGNHFYRSDTGMCLRCRRYRPEVYWNNENMPELKIETCDRCTKAIFNNGKDLE